MHSYHSPDAVAAPRVSYVHAGFLVRFIAYVLDNVFLMLICLVMGLGIGMIFDLTALAVLEAVWQAVTIVALFYYISFWAMVGATPGKLLLGLRIVDEAGNTEGIGWLRALLRMFGYWLGTLLFYLGFIWIAIDGDKQGWHDKIARTYVVHV